MDFSFKLDMGLILYIVAVLLLIPLTIINLFAVIYKYGFKFSTFNGYFHETAIDIDKFGNRNFRTLLNMTLKIDKGYRFGNANETISSAIGKNKRDSTLSTTGKVVCRVLDYIDENHCIKSINETV